MPPAPPNLRPSRAGRGFAGGPGGRGSFRFTSRFREVYRQIEDAEASAMDALAKDVELYLRNTLHRWHAHDDRRGLPMADQAFADVYATPSGQIVLVFGSEAPWTFYHEVVFGEEHAQLRITADIWLPKVRDYLRSSIGGIR